MVKLSWINLRAGPFDLQREEENKEEETSFFELFKKIKEALLTAYT